MSFLCSGAFWGLILVLIGISLIVRVVFHVHIPVVRLTFGLIIIYIGVRLIAGGFGTRCGGWNSASFTESRINTRTFTGREHSVVFGKSAVDATGPITDGKTQDLDLNTVFGQTDLRISAAVPTLIKVSAAFSGVQFPDGTTIAFGDYTFKNKGYTEAGPVRTIRVNVVFGGLKVIEE